MNYGSSVLWSTMQQLKKNKFNSLHEKNPYMYY